MIPDRIIEQGTLTKAGAQTAVEIRLPWYRALPGSCISDVALTLDGQTVPADSLTWTMNGTTFTIPELADEVDQWWFPADSVVLTGNLELPDEDIEHRVEVDLKIFIPYIVTAHGVLRIEEHDSKSMKAVAR